METFRDFLTILSGLLTPTLGVVGAIILNNQYRLEKLRWRLALYDKRYPVYIKTMEFLSKISGAHNVTNDQLFAFLRDSRDKEFLFGEDVQKLLGRIYEKALDLNTFEATLNGLPVGDERTRRVEESSKAFKWLTEQFATCKATFGEYLKVDEK